MNSKNDILDHITTVCNLVRLANIAAHHSDSVSAKLVLCGAKDEDGHTCIDNAMLLIQDLSRKLANATY